MITRTDKNSNFGRENSELIFCKNPHKNTKIVTLADKIPDLFSVKNRQKRQK